jgi:hypothetical protein
MLANGIMMSLFWFGEVGDFLVRHAPAPGGALAVHGEDDARDLALPVILGRLRNGRPLHLLIEVVFRRLFELLRKLVGWIAKRDFGVCVHVNGDQLVNVHRKSRARGRRRILPPLPVSQRLATTAASLPAYWHTKLLADSGLPPV